MCFEAISILRALVMPHRQARIETDYVSGTITFKSVVGLFISMSKENRITAYFRVYRTPHHGRAVSVRANQMRGRCARLRGIREVAIIPQLGKRHHRDIAALPKENLHSTKEIDIDRVAVVIKTRDKIRTRGTDQPIARIN